MFFRPCFLSCFEIHFGRVLGSILERFWEQFSLNFCSFVDFLFGLILGGFWVHFGRSFALCLEVFFDTFSDLAKNVAPHESNVNSSRTEGLAPGTTIKKPLKKWRNNVTNAHTKNIRILDACLLHFGMLLGAFWKPKGDQQSSEILDVFSDAILDLVGLHF